MRKQFKQFLMMMVALAAATGNAYADSSGSLPSSLGAVINNMGAQLYKSLPMMLVCGCYVFSFWLAADGVMKLYERAKPGGGRGPDGGHPYVRILISGLFALLPTVLNTGIATIFGGVPGAVTGGHVYSPQVCLVGQSDQSAALTCVARNIGVNVVPVGIKFIFAASYIGGVCVFIKALYDLAKHHNSPQHGAAKPIAKMGVATLMLIMPTFINTVTTSMGYGNATVLAGNVIGLGDSVPSILAYSGDGGNSDLTKFSELISWLFVIVSLFGVWFVAVGINKLNSSVDGHGGEKNNIRAALTHIVGGALMVNGKFAMCLIVSTFVGNGHGFC